jgi:hypothetical protein
MKNLLECKKEYLTLLESSTIILWEYLKDIKLSKSDKKIFTNWHKKVNQHESHAKRKQSKEYYLSM